MLSVSATIGTLFRELVDGRTTAEAYVLNEGDVGLLRSLDKLSAEEASHSAAGGASLAAHVDHIRYSLHRLNGWASGTDLSAPDWGASWCITRVTEAEWKELRAGLSSEAAAWKSVLDRATLTDDEWLRSLASSVVHLAYHFGAIRQLASAVRGPREPQ